jgi:hypothetical protein
MNKPWKVARAFQNNGPDYFVVTNGTWGARKIACLDESSAETVRDLLATLEAFAEEFPQLANDDEPINGADAVDALCRLWPQINAAIAKAKGQ